MLHSINLFTCSPDDFFKGGGMTSATLLSKTINCLNVIVNVITCDIKMLFRKFVTFSFELCNKLTRRRESASVRHKAVRHSARTAEAAIIGGGNSGTAL
jgi:hypothetical protein